LWRKITTATQCGAVHTILFLFILYIWAIDPLTDKRYRCFDYKKLMNSVNYRSFIKRDYKLRESANKTFVKLLNRRQIVLATLSLLVGLTVLSAIVSDDSEAQISEKALTLPINDAPTRVVQQLKLPIHTQDPRISALTAKAVPVKQVAQKRIKVRKGDTLAAIFSRNKISARDVHNIIALGKVTNGLRNLRPGQHIRLAFTEQGKFTGLVHEINQFKSLQVSHGDKGYSAKQIIRKPDVRVAYANGKIRDSLFLDAKKAGLEQSLIMELAGIFGWDIDFALDIRRGDSFHVVYEEKYLDGEKIRHGNILAAEFVNRGRSYRAVRYTAENNRADYYSPDGKNMRKAFLRTPVDFRRISSRFGKRHHPVLNRMRVHKGVDYAAKRGTPVRATGDGKIIHRARKGGYGKTIIIRHGGKYSTLYAHLSSYDRKARGKVKQGQVIGYVGTTGRSTGPHLHYEFRVNGVHRNPLTVKLPSATSINKRYKQDFLNQTRGLLAQLDGIKRIDIALAP